MLITYTFDGNDGAVDIGLSRWLVGGETCEAASSTPCWGVVTPLAETVAQANINRESVYEPFLHKIIAEQTFGEVTLNLTEVGVFSNPNVCVNFGSAHVKSRSSDSFNASLKDFIPPILVNVSNCGSLTVNITTEPDNGATYAFITSDGQEAPQVSVVTDNSATYTLLPGDYSYTVSAPEAVWDGHVLIEPGYDLVEIYCTATGDGTDVTWDTNTGTVDVTIAEGGAVECEYAFVQRGSSIGEKQTMPDGDPAIFDFSGDLGPLGPISDGETIPIYDLTPGTYLVTEDTLPDDDWDLTDISCVDSDALIPSLGDPGTATATFNLDPDETVTCTFTNTKRGTIILEKQTNPDGAAGDFTFTGDLGPLGPISDGGSITVPNMVPGAYMVTEADPTPAFDLTSIVCDDGNSTGNVGTRTATFNLDPGETVTCNFTNTKRAQIFIEKETFPSGDLQIFGFTLKGGPSGLNQGFDLTDGGQHYSGFVIPGSG